MKTRVLWPNFRKRRGLITVVTVDKFTNRILMVASANAEAFRRTLETGIAHYYSRSRKELWRKGKTSGNEQVVYDVLIDCDGDAVVYLVGQRGNGACHTGAKSCFFRSCLRPEWLERPPQMTGKETLSGREVDIAPPLWKVVVGEGDSAPRAPSPCPQRLHFPSS